MCEIAIAAPGSDKAVETVTSVASQLYAENEDGLGVVAIHRVADDQFLYNRYKRADPSFEDGDALETFIDRNDGAFRFVIHARLATHGGTGWAETHPIQTAGCPQCDIDMAVHNGVVYGERRKRNSHEEEGHRYSTDVDSEVIAHEYGELPDSLGEDYEEPALNGNLNYILFADDRVLVRHTAKYNVTEHLTMSTAKRDWVKDSAEKAGIHLFHADGTHESTEIRGRSRYRGRRQGAISTASQWASQAISMGQRQSQTAKADSCESGTCDTDKATQTSITTSGPSLGSESSTNGPGRYGTEPIENFPDAVPGELTERKPIERDWITSVQQGGGADWHYCHIHGKEFYRECKECRSVDKQVYDNTTASSSAATTKLNSTD